MSIQDNLLDAVDILIDKAVSSAKFDKTIQGTIVSCIDSVTGKYKIKYQGGSFYAFANDVNIQYKDGVNVYILIPEGDFEKTKTIISAVNKKGLNQNHIIPKEEQYEDLTPDIIGNEDGSPFKYKSYGYLKKGNNQIDYLYIYADSIKNDYPEYIDKAQFVNKVVIRQEEFALIKNKNVDSFVLRGAVKANIKSPQTKTGNFGFGVTLAFKSDNNTNTPMYLTYIVDITKMTGNPYNQISFYPQRDYFNIDNKKFLYVENMFVFVKGFELQAEQYFELNTDKNEDDALIPYDIEFQDFELYGTRHLTDNQISSLNVVIKSNYTRFTLKRKEIQLNTQLKRNGFIQKIENAQYYWFKKQSDITAGSQYFHRYGGNGWALILNENNDNTIISASDILTEQRDFKCVVVYEDNNTIQSISDVITLYQDNYQYKINITASQDTFHLGGELSELKCEITPDITDTEIQYVWSSNSNEQYQIYDDNHTGSITCYSSTFADSITYYCSVYLKENNEYIGEAYKTLRYVNDDTIAISDLIIQNAPVIYNYDEYGNSPLQYKKRKADSNDNIEILIQPLTFSVVDRATNNVISASSAINGNQQNAKWYILHDKKQRMIDSNASNPAAYADKDFNLIDNKDNAYYDVYFGENFSYTIDARYDINKINGNNVWLKLEYNNSILSQIATISCIKTGDPGTNGTNKVVKVKDTEGNYCDYHHFTCKRLSKNARNYIINNGKTTDGKNWFVAELYENSQKIYDSSMTDLREQYSTKMYMNFPYNFHNVGTFSTIRIDSSYSDYYFHFIDTWSNDYSFPSFYLQSNYDPDSINKNFPVHNIVKIQITDNNTESQYQGYVPIYTIILDDVDEYDCDIVDGTGFNYIRYDSDGAQGTFDNNSPFEFKITYGKNGNKAGQEVEESKIQYEWYEQSFEYRPDEYDFYKGTWEKVEYLKIIDNESKYPTITPVKRYEGNSTSISLGCFIKINGVKIAYVHMPIYTYLNTAGFARLNDWDGQSLVVKDKDDGCAYILAPQIGAGEKNSSNQFSGIVMGTMASEQYEYDEKTNKIKSYQTSTRKGIIGLKDGVQTFCLDSDNGSAEFGIHGKITINGEDTVISYSDGSNIKFQVDKDGSMTCAGGIFTDGEIKCGSKGGKYYFTVTDRGLLTCQGAKISNTKKDEDGDLDIQFQDDAFLLSATKYDKDANGNTITRRGYISSAYNKFLFCTEYPGQGQQYVQDDEGNWILKETNLIKGIDYAEGNLRITGELIAATGIIGGWKINADRLESINGSLKLYGDGRIVGQAKGEDKNAEGSWESISGNELLQIRGNCIYGGSVESFTDEGNNYCTYANYLQAVQKNTDPNISYTWTPNGSWASIVEQTQGTATKKTIKSSYTATNDGNIQIKSATSFLDINECGATVTGGELYLCNKEEKFYMYNKTTNQYVANKKSNEITVKDIPNLIQTNKDITWMKMNGTDLINVDYTNLKKTNPIAKPLLLGSSQTIINGSNVQTQNIFFVPAQNNDNKILATKHQDVAGAINELVGAPKGVLKRYPQKVTTTIERDEKDNTKATITLTEQWEVSQNVEEAISPQIYIIKVSNYNDSNEQITEMICPNGDSIDFSGFYI